MRARRAEPGNMADSIAVSPRGSRRATQEKGVPATAMLRRPAIRALAILVLAIAVRGIYFDAVARTACLAINHDPISDMDTFQRWALTIAGGDWLGRSDFHPFHPWQGAVAPEEQWNAWYGHTFHQEPFYPYAIAMVYAVLPVGFMGIIMAQMLFGAAGCAFVYLAARRIVPEGAALAAGALSAIYGPYLYYESLLLRDSFLIPLHAALLWVMLEARARSDHGKGWWVAAGALSAIAFLTKASILPFIALFAVMIMWERRGEDWKRRSNGPALLLAGFAVAMVPCVARNLIVGAPPLKTTTRGPIEFINGNNPWHIGTGWFDGDDQRVSAYAQRVLAGADGRLWPTISAVVADWKDDLSGLAYLQIRKLGYFLAPFEMPNNASYAYFRLRCPVLRFLPSFFWVLPLAAAGVIASIPRWRQMLPVFLFLGCGIAVTVAFYVIARFRAPLVPAITILAGLGTYAIVAAFRQRRMLRGAGLVTLVLGLLVIEARADYPDRALVRPQDFLIAIEDFRHRGSASAALREADEARALFPSIPEFPREAGLLNLDLGRRGEAVAALEAAYALDPSDAVVRRALASLNRGESP